MDNKECGNSETTPLLQYEENIKTKRGNMIENDFDKHVRFRDWYMTASDTLSGFAEVFVMLSTIIAFVAASKIVSATDAQWLALASGTAGSLGVALRRLAVYAVAECKEHTEHVNRILTTVGERGIHVEDPPTMVDMTRMT